MTFFSLLALDKTQIIYNFYTKYPYAIFRSQWKKYYIDTNRMIIPN